MKLKDFDYYLPKNLIAQEPVKPRDHSRLLILNKKTNNIKHKHFYDIIDYLKTGDVLVLNNSKVFPARLIGKKKKTNGKMEVFLHKKYSYRRNAPLVRLYKGDAWQCLLGGHGRKEDLEIEFGRGLECKIIKNNQDGTWNVKFNKSGKELMSVVNKIGKMPLPPYIKRPRDFSSRYCSAQDDKVNYQTVYADEKKIGSVAAPTAGFHFTPRLIRELKNKGVQIEYITLHVGLGTFAPVKTDNIKKHKMHAEYVEVKKNVAEKINKAKKEGRRVIAVGTTSVRSLEAMIHKAESHKPASNSYQAWVDIFIYPGYKFKITDAMITNFHLPKSTLLILVSAFANKENIDEAYKAAIKEKYRFYSYGDAMFIY